MHIYTNMYILFSWQGQVAPLAEPEDDTCTPLIGIKVYKQNKIRTKRSFRSKAAYENERRPYSDGLLDEEPPSVPPKKVYYQH